MPSIDSKFFDECIKNIRLTDTKMPKGLTFRLKTGHDDITLGYAKLIFKTWDPTYEISEVVYFVGEGRTEDEYHTGWNYYNATAILMNPGMLDSLFYTASFTSLFNEILLCFFQECFAAIF